MLLSALVTEQNSASPAARHSSKWKCDLSRVGGAQVNAAAEAHLPRLMTPRGIPVGVLKAGSSFSPNSNTLDLKTWKGNKQVTMCCCFVFLGCV